MTRPRFAPCVLLLACLPGAGAFAAPMPADTEVFPYPGKYTNGWCSLELRADGAYDMKSIHCPFPQDDDGFIVELRGHAELKAGRLELFGDGYLQVDCRSGPRFVPPNDLHAFALALHAGDPEQLRTEGGFRKESAPAIEDCDPAPLPSALRRIAEAPPVVAKVVSIVESRCDGGATDVSCETTFIVDRGYAHGLEADMRLYFPQCSGMDYAMSVDEAQPDSASAHIYWRPRHGEQAPWLLGKSFTTRMPACRVPERERIERENEESE